MSRILIVDDQTIVASYLERTLDSLGYNVVGKAFSGEEAVNAFDRYNPDIILMDIVMPGSIDGITAAEIIKKKKNIPVVFLTAFPDDLYIQRAAQSCASGFLVKPINTRSIKAAVEIALCAGKIEKNSKNNTDAQDNNANGYIEKQSFMQELLNNTDYAVLLVNENGTIKLNNRILSIFLEKISGKNPGTGTPLTDYLPSSYIPLFTANFKKALCGDQVYVERHFSDESGLSLWLGIRYVPIKLQDSFVSFVLITIRNLTDEKTVAASLERCRAQYSATINSMYDPLFIVDANLQIEFYNESFKRWMGGKFRDNEIINTSIVDAFPFAGSDIVREYKTVMKTGEPFISKVQWKIHGLPCFYETVKVPVKENDVICGVITIIRDITDIFEMEQTIQKMLIGQLTNKEYEVLNFIARGLSRKEIAQEMSIAIATYDKHLRNIKKKLKITSHEGLVSIMERVLRGKNILSKSSKQV